MFGHISGIACKSSQGVSKKIAGSINDKPKLGAVGIKFATDITVLVRNKWRKKYVL